MFVAWYPKNGALGPLRPTHPRDQIALAGEIIPCHHARIEGGEGLEQRMDKKGGLGGNGARPTFHGIDPKGFQIGVYFSTVEQENAFAFLVASIGPGLGPDPSPVPIVAQQLQHLPITAVKVFGVSPESDSGLYKKISLKCVHWLSPLQSKTKKATHTPDKPANLITDEAAKRQNPPPALSLPGLFKAAHALLAGS